MLKAAHCLNVRPPSGYYVDVKNIDGDLREVSLEDSTPDGGTYMDMWNSGKPVRIERMPTKMQWLETHGRPVPDFDTGLILNVSARAKAIIERFEPPIHQFVRWYVQG